MLESVKQLVNGNKNAETLKLADFCIGMDETKSIDLEKRMKNELKEIKKGGQRSYFLPKFLATAELAYEYIKLQNQYIAYKIASERERAKTYSENKEEAEKYGFYNETEMIRLGKKIPKQTEEQIAKWADQAYPKLQLALWETEMDLAILSAYVYLLNQKEGE